MPCTSWSKKDIPSLDGKLVLVTGGTGGLGYETCLALAEAKATVIVAGRNDDKGKVAVEKIKAAIPDAKVSFGKVDLGSLESIKAFCTQFNNQNQTLDILVNNAGIMSPKTREVTADNFEIQLGTNHLGHFALTAQLLPSLRKSASPRVVNVSSIAARRGKINFEDLQSEKQYADWAAYGQSKLANLLFTLELQRRNDAGNWGLTCCSAHPGLSNTDLITNGPGEGSTFMRLNAIFIKPFFSQTSAAGALPQMFAAVSPDAKPGAYYGPNGMFEIKGAPTTAAIPAAAKDLEVAGKLWDISCTLTGVTWP